MPIDSIVCAQTAQRAPRRDIGAAARTARAASPRRRSAAAMPMKPRNASRGSVATAAASAGASRARTPLFVASPLMFTCTSTSSGASHRRARGGQPLRDLQPVDALDAVEHLGGQRRLVALERADQHPLRGRRGRRAPRAWSPPPGRSSRRTRAGRPHARRARRLTETSWKRRAASPRPALAPRTRGGAAMRDLMSCNAFS